MSKDEDEGARSFARFFTLIDDGGAEVECSAALQALAQKLREESQATQGEVAGTLTLTLKLKVHAEVCTVGYSLKAKEPEPKRASSIFWLTKGGNLTPENPRQQKLAFVAEVPKPETREAPAGAAETRSI